MSNYIILSEKSWNKNLARDLQEKFPDVQWYLIDNKDDFNIQNLNTIHPDYIFIPHWSHIILDEIFSQFECVVFHMTDLPYGRGGSPLQNLISKELTETKISALKVVKELDAGPIYIKESLSLIGTAEDIFIRANKIIKEMIIKIIDKNLVPQKQEGEPTTFKRRKPEMSSIADIDSLEKLYDHIRMLDAENYPKAYLETEFFKFEFNRASLKANESIIADVRIIKK